MKTFDVTVVRELKLRYHTEVEADDSDSACLLAEQQAQDVPAENYDLTDQFVEYKENIFKGME